MTSWQVLVGDVREKLAEIPESSVQSIVTSPPYWSLRDYGVAPTVWGGVPAHSHEWEGIERQAERYTGKRKWQHIGEEAQAAGVKVRDIDPNAWGHPKKSDTAFCACGAWLGAFGLEPTPDLFVGHLVEVFRACRRVLRKDGTLWINLGDSYAAGGGGSFKGLKAKDLVGIPWMAAFALRADGWYLRSDIVWSKPNPMPESVIDRPTKSHEYVFLLSKSKRYFYDAAAIRTPFSASTLGGFKDDYQGQATKPYAGTGAQNASDVKRRIVDKQRGHSRRHAGFNDRWDVKSKDEQQMGGANARSVWTFATQPYPEAHFATFPEALPERCIKAGSKLGDVILDPFCGSGTTGQVAIQLGRSFIGIELNPTYAELSRKRIGTAAPLFSQESA